MTPNNTPRDVRNYHGKYYMNCEHIRKAQYSNGMMCVAFTYGTCMCDVCSRNPDVKGDE